MKSQKILEKIADINYDFYDDCKIRAEEYSDDIFKILRYCICDGAVLGIFSISQDEAEEIYSLILEIENNK